MSKKKGQNLKAAKNEQVEEPLIEPVAQSPQPSPFSDKKWLISCGAITFIAIFLRFFMLGLKPFHHDEGVNGWFLTNLFRSGVYTYDPANYHGPTLYYISLAFAQLFGLETVTLRASVAVFGVLMVILTFYLRPYIGRSGSLFAALLLAISPGMVYISRYFIHEIFFVLLSLTLVLAVLMFMDREKAGPGAKAWLILILAVCFLPSGLSLAKVLGGDAAAAVWAFRVAFIIVEAFLIFFIVRTLSQWNGGRPIYMLLAASSLALSFATKETGFITFGTMLIALVCIWGWQKVRGTTGLSDKLSIRPVSLRSFISAFGSSSDAMLLIGGSLFLFLYLIILFFSSFFTYFDGVPKALEAYAIWTKTGSKDHTGNGTWAYFTWTWEVEAPILVLSAVGSLIAFYTARHRVAMFTALWGFGLAAAYTIIPYKTPWLALSFLMPMAFSAGYAINELYESGRRGLQVIAILAVIVSAGFLGYKAYDLNFVEYDNNSRPYIYAHTDRQFLSMMSEINFYAEKTGKVNELSVDVLSPEYWPMTWYVRNNPKVVFHSRMIDSSTADVIIGRKGDQDNDLMNKYSGNYRYVGTYPLRPGVSLIMLVRKDIAEPDTKEVYRLADKNP